MPLHWLLLLAVFQIPLASFAQRFQASGQVVYWNKDRPEGAFNKAVRNFVVKRDGERWFIHVTDGNPKPGSDLFGEAGYDGTNTFTLHQQDPKEVRRVLGRDTINSGHYVEAVGRVDRGSVPRMNLDLIYFVWLSYASAASVTNGINPTLAAPVWDDPFGKKPAFQMLIRWSKSDGGSFADEIVWFTNGVAAFKGVGNDGKEIYSYQAAANSDGFTQARFKNLSWTNFDGVTLPASFTLVYYGIDVDPVNPPERFQVDGSLWSVSHLEEPLQIPPKITTKTGVDDYRMLEKNVTYMGTRWYITDQELKDYVSFRAAGYPGMEIPSRNDRAKAHITILFVMCGSLVTLIFVALYRRFENKKNKQ